MRKLLIISVSALSLSAGTAFAQSNTSDVEQIGSSITATINQKINNGTSNSSTVYQGYAGNGDPAYNSSATVTQIGGGNNSVISSGIQQNDGYQTATVYQNASNGGTQTSGITQSNYGNTANVTQITANSTDKQVSYVTQSGQYGLVTVSQGGPNDYSNVVQTGNYNNGNVSGSTAYQAVSGGVNVNQGGSSTNISNVNQYSDYSGVAVTQNGSAGGTNISTVTQSGGNSNFASVYQTAGAVVTNTSTIGQNGTGNIAGVYQH